MKISDFLYDEIHATRYLTDCIIKYKETLYLIKEVSFKNRKNISLSCIKLPLNNNKYTILELFNKDIDLYPSKLGFVNTQQNITIYIYRTTRKVWKLGLPYKSLYMDTKVCGNTKRLYSSRISEYLADKVFIDSLLGNYINPFDKVFDSIAISNTIAINSQGRVYTARNRRISIGKIIDKIDNIPTIALKGNFFYLKEVLEGYNFNVYCEHF